MGVLQEPKGTIIKLADGKDYILAPLTLNTLANLEEAFDCDLSKLQVKLASKTASGFRKLLWVLLQDNHPDVSLQDAGKLVSLDQMGEIITQLTSVLEGLNTDG